MLSIRAFIVLSLITVSRLISLEEEKSDLDKKLQTKGIEESFCKCLKKCKHKDDNIDHSLSKIDFIYTITRKNCHRWDLYKFIFEKYGLHPYRFTSFSKKELTKKRFNSTCLRGGRSFAGFKGGSLVSKNFHPKLVIKNMSSYDSSYIHPHMSIRQLCSSLDHISIIKDALDSGYNYIWVMDSSVKLRCDPNIMATYVSQADSDIPGWTIIYTDYGERDLRDNIKMPKKFYKRPDVEFLSLESYLQRGVLDHDIHSNIYWNGDTCRSLLSGNKTCLEVEDGLTVPIVSYDPSFAPVGILRGAHSYIMNRKGMKLVYDYYIMNKIYVPYWQEIQMIEGMKPYCLLYPVTRSTNNS